MPADRSAAPGEYPYCYRLRRGGSQRLCRICVDALCPPGPRLTGGAGFDEGRYVDELSFQKPLSSEEEGRLRAYWNDPRCDQEAHVRLEKACNDRELAELHERRLEILRRPSGWSLQENAQQLVSLSSAATEQGEVPRTDEPARSGRNPAGGAEQDEVAGTVWRKAQLQGPLAVVDVETTGRDPCRHRVVECGLILLGTDLAVREQHVWALSITDLELMAAEPAAHALWRERLERRWAAGEAVPLASWGHGLVRLVQGHRLASWRIAFDQSFLKAELRRAGLDVPWDFRESLDVPSWLEGLGWRPPSLREAAKTLGLVPWVQHDALADALVTAGVIRTACGIYGPVRDARGSGSPGESSTEEQVAP